MSVLVGGAGETGGIGPVLSNTISANTETYTFSPSQVPGYIAGNTTATLTINNGVYLYSNSISTPALTVSGWAAGDTVYIVNNGYIIGRGGDGGSYNPTTRSTTKATNGGDAISLQFNATIYNNGFIAGGGGGGGASNFAGGAGGGGAGGGYGGSVFASAGGTGQSSYTINGTGTVTANIFVQSTSYNYLSPTTGTNSGPGGGLTPESSFVLINGVKLREPTLESGSFFKTGHNLYVINPANMSLESAKSFNTYTQSKANYPNGLLSALQSVVDGRIVAIYAADAIAMDKETKDYLINNYGDVYNPTGSGLGSLMYPTYDRLPILGASLGNNSRVRFPELFVSIKGAQPNTAVHIVANTTQGTGIVNTTVNVVSTGFTPSGSTGSGGAGGTIGNAGSDGVVATSGDSFGSGGGGGRILPGVGGQNGISGRDVKGFGGGAGGGGGGGNGAFTGADGGAGGSANAAGSNAVQYQSADGGGGGGGWGAPGGNGTITGGVTTPGAGGKCVALNGKRVIFANPGTLYGAVS